MVTLDENRLGFGIGVVWSVGLVFALLMGVLFVVFYMSGTLAEAASGSEALLFGMIGSIFSIYGVIGGIVLALCYWALVMRRSNKRVSPRKASKRKKRR